jgi:hypothetical protein
VVDAVVLANGTLNELDVADVVTSTFVAFVAVVAVVAEPAVVADVAVEALPFRVAVIVPALKLPEASRATTLDTVFAEVASTAKVLAVEPLNVPSLVKYVPAVSAAAVALAVVAVVAVVALPDKEAVIVPAEKLPEPSRTTTLLAVLAVSASTAHVVAAEPLKFDPVK